MTLKNHPHSVQFIFVCQWHKERCKKCISR